MSEPTAVARALSQVGDGDASTSLYEQLDQVAPDLARTFHTDGPAGQIIGTPEMLRASP